MASGRKAETGTIYSICSISKLFTSIAVLQLRDAGKLRLDDPVSRAAMGRAARRRAEASFDYALLAPRLSASLSDVNG